MSEVNSVSAYFDHCLPLLLLFVPVDTNDSGSIVLRFRLVFVVNGLSDVAKVFDSVVLFVLVLVVDFVSWPCSVNDEPDYAMEGMRCSIDFDCSVALGVSFPGDVSFFGVSCAVLFPDQVFAVVEQ